MSETPLLTVSELAARLSVHPRTVRRWVRNGSLPCVRVGRGLRVSADDVGSVAARAKGGRMARLPHGLFQRPGRAGYYVRVPGENGKERWLCLGRDREVATARFWEEKSQGAVRRGEVETMRDLARLWVKRYIPTARTGKNAVFAGQRVEQHLCTAEIADIRATALTGDDLRAYRLALEAKGLTVQTVSLYLRDLGCMLRWAIGQRYIVRNPWPKKGLLPRLPDKVADALSEDEIARLTALEEPFGFALRLALGCGARWAELCAMRREDLIEGNIVIRSGKGGKARSIPLHPTLRREVQGHIGPLFGFSVTENREFTRDVRKLSGVERFHPHLTRSTYATRLLESGCSLLVVQRLLGHADPSTTLLYLRVADKMVERELERAHFGVAVSVAKA